MNHHQLWFFLAIHLFLFSHWNISSLMWEGLEIEEGSVWSQVSLQIIIFVILLCISVSTIRTAVLNTSTLKGPVLDIVLCMPLLLSWFLQEQGIYCLRVLFWRQTNTSEFSTSQKWPPRDRSVILSFLVLPNMRLAISWVITTSCGNWHVGLKLNLAKLQNTPQLTCIWLNSSYFCIPLSKALREYAN